MVTQGEDCVISQAVFLFTQIVTDDASETVPLDTIGCAQAAAELSWTKNCYYKRKSILKGQEKYMHVCASTSVRTFIKVRLTFGLEARLPYK